MQELQRRLFDVGTKQRPITVDEMNSFIEKEKQQIIKAHSDGLLYQRNSEEYYNQTFKQD